jgi:hypothetical protein
MTKNGELERATEEMLTAYFKELSEISSENTEEIHDRYNKDNWHLKLKAWET